MADEPEDMRLTLLVIDGIAHRFAIDRRPLVIGGHLRIPALQGLVEGIRIDACEHIADAAPTGYSQRPLRYWQRKHAWAP